MLKKMVILGVIGFVAVAALGGTKLASYIRSEINSARERAEANIPPEKEIARLRNEIKLLEKDIDGVISELAKQNVAVRNLEVDVKDLTDKQTAFKAELKTRAEAIKNAEGHVTFGSKTMSIVDAKADLEANVKRYATNQKSLESMQALLANRMKMRDSLVKQLDTMKAQKTELAAAVDDMEAQLAALKLQQMESKYQTDDTRLAKIKEDLRKLKTKVEEDREKLKIRGTLEASPTPSSRNEKSVDEIMSGIDAQPSAKPEGQKTETKVPVID